MKRSILSIILLALIISLTATVGSSNLITAYAIENYLQLRSANVDYHGGDIDVDIRTRGDIPSESGNNGFDTSFPIDVKGNKISIDDVNTNDLASGTVKAIASFTAEAITNNGKIKQICIDIQDVLKQSEIGVSYNNDDNDDNDDHDKDDDKNKNRHKDDNKKDNDDKDKSQHKDDNDDDSLFKTDIDQDIDQR